MIFPKPIIIPISVSIEMVEMPKKGVELAS